MNQSSTGEPEFHQEIKNKEKYKENRANSFSNNANTKKTNDKYEDFFEKIWKLYPNKKGKSSVSKKTKKIIYHIGTDKMVKAIATAAIKKLLQNSSS